MIVSRLEAAIERAGGLAPNQFGFRKRRSTLDAIETVTSLAANAIAGARWKKGAKEYCLVVTQDIRNAFNSADWRRTLEALEAFSIPGYLLRIVRSYLSERSLIVDTSQVAGLELASHKTEAVLISSRKRVETAEIRVGGLPNTSQRALRYLGVILDTRLCYREHLEYVHKKASETARSLSRILLNTRGPKQCKRKLLMSVVTSQLLYAAPAWAEAVKVRSYVRGVEGTYRLCALRVACAFRTVSDDAALVIAGQVPICELVREAQEVRLSREPDNSSARREARVSARRRSIAWWQPEDHSPECVHHVLFDCHRFHHERLALEEVVGAAIGADNLVPIMLASQKAWDATATFVASVMKTLRTLETERRMPAE
nr:uncharacterized protein LOC121502620 [Drosophila kikkawai]